MLGSIVFGGIVFGAAVGASGAGGSRGSDVIGAGRGVCGIGGEGIVFCVLCVVFAMRIYFKLLRQWSHSNSTKKAGTPLVFLLISPSLWLSPLALILLCLTFPCHFIIRFCRALPCLALPCLALPCLALPSIALPCMA